MLNFLNTLCLDASNQKIDDPENVFDALEWKINNTFI